MQVKLIVSNWNRKPYIKANKIFVAKNLTIKASYNQIVANNFGSEIQALNFSEKIVSANIINSWVEAKTNNKIKDVIDPNTLSKSMNMISVNAIYFKGAWAKPFEKRLTFKGPFYITPKKIINVNFMSKREKFSWGSIKNLGASAVELLYNEPGFSMVFILPDKTQTLSQVESKLPSISYEQIKREMYFPFVNLDIPRFKFKFDIDLYGPLQQVRLSI